MYNDSKKNSTYEGKIIIAIANDGSAMILDHPIILGLEEHINVEKELMASSDITFTEPMGVYEFDWHFKSWKDWTDCGYEYDDAFEYDNCRKLWEK